MTITPQQALAEARHLYETRKPIGWRAFDLSTVKVADRVDWYKRQVRRAYPGLDWEEAERCFYGDLSTVLSFVNSPAGDPNLTGDLRFNFKRLCRQAKGIAARIHASEPPEELQRRLDIFGLTGRRR